MNDKRLLLSALLLPCWLLSGAQTSPGGVRGAEAWLRTEINNNIIGWTDYAGDNVKLTNPNGAVYTKSVSTPFFFNFHPALTVSSNALKTVLGHTSLKQSTTICVVAPESITGNLIGSLPCVYTQFHASQPDHSLWGENQTAEIPLAEVTPGSASGRLIPELIVWQRILNPLERLQAESYLALKYGITLNSSYYDADGNIIWDRSRNGAYHHRVAGLSAESHARSFLPYLSTTSHELGGMASSQSYKQAFWQNVIGGAPSADHLLVMGRLPDHPMADGEHLVWGDNGGTLAAVNTSSDGIWHYMNRQWKVSARTTDTVSQCNTAILNYQKTGDAALAGHAYGRVAMIIDPSGQGDFSTIDGSFRFAHYESHDSLRGAITFHDFGLDDGDVFTFGWTDEFLVAFTPHDATCQTPTKGADDGSIDVDIISGVPHFHYQLKVLDVAGLPANETLQDGMFTSHSMSLTGLRAGTYEITVVEQADMGDAPNAPLHIFSRHVTVGSACLGIESGVQNVDPGLADMSRRRSDDTDGMADVTSGSRLTVSPSAGRLTYTASLDATGQAMLLVCTTGGILLSAQHFSATGHPRTCTFTVPQPGVYIIKAVTDTDEYTHKLIVR